MKYLLLFNGVETEWRELSDGDRESAVASIGAWHGRMVKEGRIIQGGRLDERARAKTVRLGPAGRSTKPLVTDGPLVDAQESIGSYAVVEAATMEDAVDVASGWPAGGAIEVRLLLEG